MLFCRPVSRLVLLGVVLLAAASAQAVDLTIDYTYDTSDFFGSGNPDGAAAGIQAKAALEAAADYFSAILGDTFSPIQTPPIYHSQQSDGQVVWNWSMHLTQPTTGAQIQLNNQPVAADEYRIFVGARSLSAGTLGIGGAGGYGWSMTPTGTFTLAEIDEVSQITADFSDAVEHRGEASGFARWGGSVTFDSGGSTAWHYSHTTNPTGGTIDFYSAAIHQFAHTLGFGEIFSGTPVAEWESLVSDSYFTGAAAKSEHGGPVPLSTDQSHWADGTVSTVFGLATSQEAAMTPTLTQGTRKRLTALDAAALTDIGWTVVPEPSSLVLAVLSMLGIAAIRRAARVWRPVFGHSGPSY